MKTSWIVATLVFLASTTGWAGNAEETVRLTESLRDTELAFAATVTARDMESFADFLADDAVFVGQSVLRGKQAVLAAWQPFFDEGGPVLEWWPEVVELGDDRTLGLTRGPYTLTATDEKGQQRSSSGLFNSVWRLRDDGTWRIVFDAGCDP